MVSLPTAMATSGSQQISKAISENLIRPQARLHTNGLAKRLQLPDKPPNGGKKAGADRNGEHHCQDRANHFAIPREQDDFHRRVIVL
jgi:hypothetical protein